MINILQNRETKYYYDEAMRLSKVELPDGETVSYRYDELNRVISQINSNRTGTNYTYTPAGRIKSIEHFKGLNGHGQVLLSYAYIYNARGQRILEVEGNGQVTAYQYDPVGRLTKVYYPFSGGKKEINRIERAHYFGLEVNLDNHKEYYRQKNNPDEYIAKLLYDYRNELDVLHREIRESGRPLDLYNNGYYIEEYRYDPAGNVIMEGNAWGTINFEYNAANQLIRAGKRTYSYDANGNLIKEGYGGDYVEYNYNYENRLIKASNLSRNDKLFGGEHP
ncbi:MAG TPA: RHS repeat protein, partial [Halanaerobiaceae bacterium]|nr:RHS repeat protein [Halanaerobiaceae bacterium]